MSAIGPGDYVECVDVDLRPWQSAKHLLALRQLTVGHVYRVLGLAAGERNGLPVTSILIEGPKAINEPRVGWAPDRFRPVYRRSDKIIQQVRRYILEDA